MSANIFKRYAFAWVLLALLSTSAVAHYAFGAVAYAHEHGNLDGYRAEWARDVFENLLSEWAQLLLQVAGLRWLLFVGSPSSKEGSERHEAKTDLLVREHVRDGDAALDQLDRLYERRR